MGLGKVLVYSHDKITDTHMQLFVGRGVLESQIDKSLYLWTSVKYTHNHIIYIISQNCPAGCGLVVVTAHAFDL